MTEQGRCAVYHNPDTSAKPAGACHAGLTSLSSVSVSLIQTLLQVVPISRGFFLRTKFFSFNLETVS